MQNVKFISVSLSFFLIVFGFFSWDLFYNENPLSFVLFSNEVTNSVSNESLNFSSVSFGVKFKSYGTNFVGKEVMGDIIDDLKKNKDLKNFNFTSQICESSPHVDRMLKNCYHSDNVDACIAEMSDSFCLKDKDLSQFQIIFIPVVYANAEDANAGKIFFAHNNSVGIIPYCVEEKYVTREKYFQNVNTLLTEQFLSVQSVSHIAPPILLGGERFSLSFIIAFESSDYLFDFDQGVFNKIKNEFFSRFPKTFLDLLNISFNFHVVYDIPYDKLFDSPSSSYSKKTLPSQQYIHTILSPLATSSSFSLSESDSSFFYTLYVKRPSTSLSMIKPASFFVSQAFRVGTEGILATAGFLSAEEEKGKGKEKEKEKEKGNGTGSGDNRGVEVYVLNDDEIGTLVDPLFLSLKHILSLADISKRAYISGWESKVLVLAAAAQLARATRTLLAEYTDALLPSLRAPTDERRHSVDEHNAAVALYEKAQRVVAAAAANSGSGSFGACGLLGSSSSSNGSGSSAGWAGEEEDAVQCAFRVLREAHRRGLVSAGSSSGGHNLPPLIQPPPDHYFALFGPMLIPIVTTVGARFFREVKMFWGRRHRHRR